MGLRRGAVSGTQNSWASCRQAGQHSAVSRSRAAHPKLESPLPEVGFPHWLCAHGPPWAPQTPSPQSLPQTPLPWPLRSLWRDQPHSSGQREESWALAIFRAKIEAHGLFAQHLIRPSPVQGRLLPAHKQRPDRWIWELTPCHRQEVGAWSIFTNSRLGKQTTWPPAS